MRCPVRQVQQGEPSGLLQQRAAYQAPGRCLGRLGHRFPRRRGDRARRDHGEPRIGESLVGRPGLRQRQRLPGYPAGGLGDRLTGHRGARGEHHARDRGSGVHGVAQRTEVRVPRHLGPAGPQRRREIRPAPALGAEHRDTAHPRARRAHGPRRDPVDAEQRPVPRTGARVRPQDQAPDRADGDARRVGEVQRHRPALPRHDPDAQARGPGCGHRDAGPGEGHDRPLVLSPGQPDRVQRGVGQGRMHVVPARVLGRPGRRGHLGEDLVTARPHGP